MRYRNRIPMNTRLRPMDVAAPSRQTRDVRGHSTPYTRAVEAQADKLAAETRLAEARGPLTGGEDIVRNVYWIIHTMGMIQLSVLGKECCITYRGLKHICRYLERRGLIRIVKTSKKAWYAERIV